MFDVGREILCNIYSQELINSDNLIKKRFYFINKFYYLNYGSVTLMNGIKPFLPAV